MTEIHSEKCVMYFQTNVNELLSVIPQFSSQLPVTLFLTGFNYTSDPNNQQAITNKVGYGNLLKDGKGRAEAEVDDVINPRTRLRSYHRTEEFDRYERLCRGEEIEVDHWTADIPTSSSFLVKKSYNFIFTLYSISPLQAFLSLFIHLSPSLTILIFGNTSHISLASEGSGDNNVMISRWSLPPSVTRRQPRNSEFWRFLRFSIWANLVQMLWTQ